MSTARVRLVHCGPRQAADLALRDSGHEVVALGPDASPQVVAAVAVQEDARLVAVGDPELGAAVVGELEDDGVIVFWVTSGPRPSSGR